MNKSELKRLSAHILPSSYVEPREYLAAVYLALKEHDPAYSYVQFTEDLGFGSCNALYLIIHGQRPLTTKGVSKICNALQIKGTERRYLLSLVEAIRSTRNSDRGDAFEKLISLRARTLPSELSRDQLAFYNEWFHSVILELLSLPEASDDPAWLSKSLEPSVTELKVKKSLDLLKKIGFVYFDQNKKRLVPSQTVVSTGHEVMGMAIIRYHQQMIDLAKIAMTHLDAEKRDISSVTIAFPESKLNELKARIQNFRREILDLSASQDVNDVIIQLNMQMFPVATCLSKGKRYDSED